MKVKYGKRDFIIDPSYFDEKITVLNLRSTLRDVLLREEETDDGNNVEEQIISLSSETPITPNSGAGQLNSWDIKLILHGRVLLDSDKILSLPGGIHAKIVMVATKGFSDSDLKSRPRVRDDLSHGGSKKVDRVSRKLQKTSSFLSDGYGFESLEVLDNLPRAEQARVILQDLASDPGIQAVMRLHRWKVGCLCEMYPEGLVGVSEVCVMGLNENRGQRIRLRLRTDDLQGFRKILSIKKVLFHELAHNEHSEHGDQFYILMRQIEREVDQLDWTKSGQRLVPGSVFAESQESRTDADDTGEVLVSRLGGGELQESVSRILAVSVSPNPAPPPARWMAAVAAAARTLTAEEERMERACSTLLENNVDQSPAPGPFPPIPSEEQQQGDDKPGSEGDAPRHDEEMEQVDVGGEVVSIEVPDSQGEVGENAVAEIGKGGADKIEAALSAVDGAIAATLIADSAAAAVTAERLLRLRDSLSALLSSVLTDVDSTSALKTVVKIIFNAMTHNDAKYRRINSSSQTFQRFISPVPGALSMLQIAGFHMGDPLTLSLPERSDPGLLYLVHSILTQSLNILSS